MQFYSHLPSFFTKNTNVFWYALYRTQKIYWKGFKNTPYFYFLAFSTVIGKCSNIRHLEQIFRFLAKFWKTKHFFQICLNPTFFVKITCRYARVQDIGINLRPRSEKNHNFHKNASILINKVTFFSWNICPHDKTNLKVLRKYFRPFWGHFEAIFTYF